MIAPKLARADTGLLTRAMPVLKVRAKSINDLSDGAAFLFDVRPLVLDEGAAKLITPESLPILTQTRAALSTIQDWSAEAVDMAVRRVAEDAGVGLGKVAQPLRAALTGRSTSPGIFDVLVLLGREESLARLDDCVAAQHGD